MKKFTTKDIADYYDQTLNHYQRWWKLDKTLAVHYGFWDKHTKNFEQALENTNHFLADLAVIQPDTRILDAGCGVGGSAFFLALKYKAKVTGITLSDKQLNYARNKLNESGLSGFVDFKKEDYSQTSFDDNTFDFIWAIESITSAPDKSKFANEAKRILKPGGKLVIADYFKTGELPDPNNYLEKWRKNWSMAPFMTIDKYLDCFEKSGFSVLKNEKVTSMIRKTSTRMYWSSVLGAVPSIIYNSFHRASRFARIHYKSGFYQYRALKKGLWEYRVLMLKNSIL